MMLFILFALLAVIISVKAQYHQTDYGVKLERLELTSYNHSYFKNMQAAFVWYNRTQRVVNGSAHFLLDISTDVKIDIQLYKFLSNEYRFFPITLNENGCEGLKTNRFGSLNVARKYSNLQSCPVKPGFYYLRNAIIDFSAFPPLIPGGGYKLNAKLYHRGDFLAELDAYAVVETILKLWDH